VPQVSKSTYCHSEAGLLARNLILAAQQQIPCAIQPRCEMTILLSSLSGGYIAPLPE